MKIRSRIIAILFPLITGLCILSTGGFAQELSVDFEEQLVIGDQEDAPKEYLFGGPQFIKTDSEYRIYIADSNNSIRVFSPDGEYLKTIGRQGKGPGEFLSITAMAIGNRDELIVYDGQSRRITTFYNMGDSLENHSLSNPTWIGGTIIPLNNEQFASVAIQNSWWYKYVDDKEPVDYEDKVIHLLDSNSWEKTGSLFNVYNNMPFDKNKPLEVRFATGGSGNYQFTKLNDSTLALSHEISDSSIYLININSGEVREVQGHFAGRESYEILNWERRRSYPEERVGIVISSGLGGQVVYQKKLESRALLANDKWVLNFIQTADGGESTYNMEFLDKNGIYLGYTRIHDDFTTIIGTTQKFYPKHLDDRDQLYYVDYSSGIPVIKVAKIILEGQ